MVDSGPSGKTLDCAIRDGKSCDRNFVAELSRRAFSEYGDYEDILPSCLGDARFHTLIAECEERAVGFCMLSVGDGVGEIVAVAVDPLWRGKGIGRRLLQEVMADSRGMGIRVLVLQTAVGNLPAQGLFRRLGFEESGRTAGYYEGGQAAIGMRKRL